MKCVELISTGGSCPRWIVVFHIHFIIQSNLTWPFLSQDLRKLLKSKHVQGLELHDAHRALNKTKVEDAVDAARTAISASGGGPLFLALPANPELLAKYYDLRTLMKKVDLMMVQTHALGQVKKMTYHPSRLSGMWDMLNTVSYSLVNKFNRYYLGPGSLFFQERDIYI